MKTALEIWEAIQPKAVDILGAHVADNWLTQITPAEITNDVFIFQTSRNLNRDWINERYADDILRLLRTVQPDLKRLEIQVVKKEGKPEKPILRKPPKSEGQLEMFVPIITDLSPRDARDAMEFPFLSLTKQKRTEPIKYYELKDRNKSPAELKKIKPVVHVFAPEETGIANIWDWDIIIYCATALRDAVNAKQPVSPWVRIVPGEYLTATLRHNNKQYQESLTEGIRRLHATTVETSIRIDDQDTSLKNNAGFHWITEWRSVSRTVNTAAGPKEIVVHYEVKLCQWLMKAIQSKSLVLALDKTYFLIDGGYARWLYRLIRKSAGKGQWTWSVSSLYERSGQFLETTKRKKANDDDDSEEDTKERRKKTLTEQQAARRQFDFRLRRLVEDAKKEAIFPGYEVSYVQTPTKGKSTEPAIYARYVGSADDVEGESAHNSEALGDEIGQLS